MKLGLFIPEVSKFFGNCWFDKFMTLFPEKTCGNVLVLVSILCVSMEMSSLNSTRRSADGLDPAADMHQEGGNMSTNLSDSPLLPRGFRKCSSVWSTLLCIFAYGHLCVIDYLRRRKISS